jgi:hypothetical protein
MVCGGDGTSDRGLLLIIGKTFTSKVGTSALRDLQDKRGLDISCGFKAGIRGGGGCDVLIRILGRLSWQKKKVACTHNSL